MINDILYILNAIGPYGVLFIIVGLVAVILFGLAIIEDPQKKKDITNC